MRWLTRVRAWLSEMSQPEPSWQREPKRAYRENLDRRNSENAGWRMAAIERDRAEQRFRDGVACGLIDQKDGSYIGPQANVGEHIEMLRLLADGTETWEPATVVRETDLLKPVFTDIAVGEFADGEIMIGGYSQWRKIGRA